MNEEMAMDHEGFYEEDQLFAGIKEIGVILQEQQQDKTHEMRT